MFPLHLSECFTVARKFCYARPVSKSILSLTEQVAQFIEISLSGGVFGN